MPAYPKAFEATCALIPKTTPAEYEKDYHSAFAPLWNDIRDRSAEVHCATVIGALIADYVGRFNRTLIQHPRYPNKDLCRHIPFSGDWQTFWKEQEAGRKLHEQPKAEEVPSTFDGLAAAARFGDAEAVKRLLAQGAKPDERDDWYLTALEWAVIRGYDEVFKLLLGADQNQEFCAALEDAIHHHRPAMARSLIPLCAKQAGADAANDRNRLMNHVFGRGDLDLMKCMVAAGFSIDAGPPKGFKDDPQDPIPYRPLDPDDFWQATASRPLHAAAAKGHTEAAEFLLKLGADINRGAGHWNLTPIYSAIEGKQPGMVDYLLRHGAKLDADAKVPHQISTPIHFAVARGNSEVIRVLARHGADLNQIAKDGTPAIFFASFPYGKNKDALETLLRLGADPNVQSKESRQPGIYTRMILGAGRTAIMHVIDRGPVRCESPVVLGAPTKIDPRDCRHQGLPNLQVLLAHGAKVGATDANGLTALHYAARTDYGLEIAELLLSKGADVNARDAAGRTPLDHAKEIGLERMPLLLARHGGKSSQDFR